MCDKEHELGAVGEASTNHKRKPHDEKKENANDKARRWSHARHKLVCTGAFNAALSHTYDAILPPPKATAVALEAHLNQQFFRLP